MCLHGWWIWQTKWQPAHLYVSLLTWPAYFQVLLHIFIYLKRRSIMPDYFVRFLIKGWAQSHLAFMLWARNGAEDMMKGERLCKTGRKSQMKTRKTSRRGLVVKALDSHARGRGFKSCLAQDKDYWWGKVTGVHLHKCAHSPGHCPLWLGNRLHSKSSMPHNNKKTRKQVDRQSA